GLDASLEAAVGEFVFVVLVFGQQLLHAIDEKLFRAYDQDLVPAFLFEFTQGHAMLLEELDEVLAGDAAVLASGDAVAAEPAGIEPLAHRSGRNLTDLGDLSGGKDFLHVGHSNLCLLSPLPCRRMRVRLPGILHPMPGTPWSMRGCGNDPH